MTRKTLLDVFSAFESSRHECVLYDDGYRRSISRFDEVAVAADRFAARLRSENIHKGDKVILWSENRPEWLAALWGCLLRGVIAVPLDFRSTFDFVARIQQITHAKLLVFGDATQPVDLQLCAVMPMSHVGQDDHESSDLSSRSAVEIQPDDVAEIVFTSGSTGEPKGVILTHANILASIAGVEPFLNQYRKYLRYAGTLRLVNLLPLSHMFGQVLAAFVAPTVPASVVFLSAISPQEITTQLRKTGAVAAIVVPKMLASLREHVTQKFPRPAEEGVGKARRVWQHRRLHRFLGWRFCCFIVGGAALETDLEDFWTRRGYFVIQGYGLTEAAPIVSFNAPGIAKRGTAGKLLPGVEIQIAADGEILLRGPSITQGYFSSPEETARAFHEGWFHTGDYGELGPSGHLIIRGRKKETIVTLEGLKVIPEDVERILTVLPGVRDAAAVGKDRVRAVLVVSPGTNPEDVISLANQRLETHQRIRDVTIWPYPELPRTPATGKLKRVEILRWLEQKGAEPVRTKDPLLDLLAKYAPGRTISHQTTLDELGLSSLDRVELMTDLEQTLGTRIDESFFAGDRKVNELLSAPPPTEEPEFPEWTHSPLVAPVRNVLQRSLVLPFTRHFVKLTVTGQEILERLDGPVILAPNHQSHLDTPAILAAIPPKLRHRIAVAMWKEYFDAYFHPERYSFGKRWQTTLLYWSIAGLFNAFPLPQTELGTRPSLRYMGKLVDDGFSILIFPEGGRMEGGEIQAFQPGVGLLAAKLSLPVVPVRLRGLDRVLPRSARFPARGEASVHFGEPLRLEGNNYMALARQVEEAVRNL
jgi:long-chain acyl-CoA synthetase